VPLCNSSTLQSGPRHFTQGPKLFPLAISRGMRPATDAGALDVFKEDPLFSYDSILLSPGLDINGSSLLATHCVHQLFTG
jgi:hypothetical protein